MKKVLAWVKANLVIVIILVVTALALPALLILSGRMNSKLRETVQKQVEDDWRDIQRISVRFLLPTLGDEPPVDFTAVPNRATIDAISSSVAVLKEQRDEMLRMVETRNRQGRTILLDGPVDEVIARIERGEPARGLFPEPEAARETRLRQEARDAWVNAHVALLRQYRAGMPPDALTVAQQLQSISERERSRLMDEGRTQLDDADREELRQRLSSARLNMYQGQAQELSFYADAGVFQEVSRGTGAALPALSTIWDWQHRLWVHEDLIRAIARANSEPVGGSPMFLPESVVKRVESILVRPWGFEGDFAEASAGVDVMAQVAKDFEISPTGRGSWPLKPNPMFDVRYAEMSVIVSSARLPQLINAVSAVNFMTVLDVQLEEVDPVAALAEGFVYGGEHVVRARLTIETLWLRSWMSKLMPVSVRQAMGIPVTGHGGPRSSVDE